MKCEMKFNVLIKFNEMVTKEKNVFKATLVKKAYTCTHTHDYCILCTI